MNAEFQWWLLILGIVIGGSLVYLVLADLRTDEPGADEPLDDEAPRYDEPRYDEPRYDGPPYDGRVVATEPGPAGPAIDPRLEPDASASAGSGDRPPGS